MVNKNYKLRYLPLFYEEFGETLDYIACNLKNPIAANDLIDAVELAIKERVSSTESFEPYVSKKNRKYLYYRIYVKNFIIYYVVIDDEGPDKIMEVLKLFK